MSKVAYYAGEDFKNETLVKEGVTLVDFFATWCGPCQMLGPVLDDLSQEVDYKVVFKNGEVVDQMIGFLTKDEINQKVSVYK